MVEPKMTNKERKDFMEKLTTLENRRFIIWMTDRMTREDWDILENIDREIRTIKDMLEQS